MGGQCAPPVRPQQRLFVPYLSLPPTLSHHTPFDQLTMYSPLLTLPAILLALPAVLAGFSQGTVNLTRDYAIEVSPQSSSLACGYADESWEAVLGIRQHGGLLH